VTLFEEESAYLGSANLIEYGFERCLEWDVLLEAAVASQYRYLSEYLIASYHVTKANIH
jgi:putative cardiolipin synthase